VKEFTDQCFLAILMAIAIAGILYVHDGIAAYTHPVATGMNPD